RASSSNRLLPPDVAAARAAEAAALHDIEANFLSERKAQFLEALTGAQAIRDGKSVTIRTVKTPTDPVMQARIDRYYDARKHRGDEERRAASIDAAGSRSAYVTVVLGSPPNGTVAAVLRRSSKFPENVIVLGPNATGETLGAAFFVLNQSR